MNTPKTVLIISTLDTKREETRYLKYKFKEIDVLPLLMDLSMRGTEPSRAELTSSDVASAGGSTIEEINLSRERSTITNSIIDGATKIARDLYKAGKIHGVMAIGGSTGSLMATDVRISGYWIFSSRCRGPGHGKNDCRRFFPWRD